MNRLGVVLGGTLLAALGGGSAQAADLARHKAPIIPPVHAATWTGIYAGLGFGYGAFNMNNVNLDDRVTPVLPAQDTGGTGWLGTAVIGFDVQVHPRVVIGAFADVDWMDISGAWRDRSGGGNVSGTLTQEFGWAAGARLGYLSNPDTLLYLNGGYTQAHLKRVDFVPFGDTEPNRYIPSQTQDGWFLGGGAETKLLPNLSAKIEYRYADFGNTNVDRLNSATDAFTTQVNQRLTSQTVRIGLNYRLNHAR